MRINSIALVIAASITLSSCDLFKKSSQKKDDDIAVINLDTIQALSQTTEPAVYQASETRINDLLHTKLDVSFDWGKQYLYGKATLTLKPYFYPTSTLSLDARGMEIREVSLVKTEKAKDTPQPSGKTKTEPFTPQPTVTKQALKYKYENDVIVIELGSEYKNNEEYTVFIEYVAKPNELKSKGGSAAITDDKGLYFINPEGKDKKKPMQIWTQGETQSSSVWYPTIDRPNERQTQEIYMTVDKKYTTLSNGELAFSTDNGDGTRTDYWKSELPFAPYLTMMAIGEFAVVRDTKWRGKEVNYYVEKEYEPHAKAIFGNTSEMLEFYSNKLGVEYPWNKYSQVVVRDYVSGAMENVSATLHGEFMNSTDRELLDGDHEDVIAHELFHQWFGDLVTCESWSNLPLNESFATYGEYLWIEHKYGKDAADLHSAQSRAGYIAESSRKQVSLIRFQFEDKEDMFDAHSYNKGGQVLHMLRKYVGDDAFFASLKQYLETHKYSSVEIHDLRLAFEKITGEDLNWFFNQWFMASGHPDLVIRSTYDDANKKQKIQIRQTQDLTETPLFRIPMYVDVYTSGGQKQRHRISVTKADETFELDVKEKPLLVNVDAEKMLLCTKDEQKTNEEWAYQYYNGPLFLDRYEAITELSSKGKDSIAAKVILAALNDKQEDIRYGAIGMLKDIQSGNAKAIKERLVTLAKSDPKAIVRATATEYLTEHYTDQDLQPLYKNGLNDRSYNVLGASLAGIAKADPAEGMRLAKQYETEKSVSVLYAIADLYSKYGNDDQNNFFISSEEHFNGFEKIGFITQYGAFLKRASKDETVNSGVSVFERIAKDDGISKWVAYYAKKSIKDLMAMYQDREESAAQKLKTLKEANPNAGGTQELEAKIASARAQKEKLAAIYNGLK